MKNEQFESIKYLSELLTDKLRVDNLDPTSLTLEESDDLHFCIHELIEYLEEFRDSLPILPEDDNEL